MSAQLIRPGPRREHPAPKRRLGRWQRCADRAEALVGPVDHVRPGPDAAALLEGADRELVAAMGLGAVLGVHGAMVGARL
jgi:hypothetical protein